MIHFIWHINQNDYELFHWHLQSLDQLLLYLSSNLQVLHERLMSAIYPRVVEQLWTTVVTLFDEQLKIGVSVNCFENSDYMLQHLFQALKTMKH